MKKDFIIAFDKQDGLREYLEKCKENGDSPEDYLGEVFHYTPLYCQKVSLDPDVGVITLEGCTVTEELEKEITEEAVTSWMTDAISRRFKRSDNVGIPPYSIQRVLSARYYRKTNRDERMMETPEGSRRDPDYYKSEEELRGEIEQEDGP